VRTDNEKIIPQALTRCLADLSARLAELTHRVEAIEIERGSRALSSEPDSSIIESDNSRNRIEFVTESGFVIVRPWEAGASPAPADGNYRFLVQEPDGNERSFAVRISNRLMLETAMRTNNRIPPSSAFWIVYAERHLANYLDEHDEIPAGQEMSLGDLDREDVLLTIRWEKSH